MGIWAPVLATLAINAFGVAFFYGVSWQKVKSHGDALKWIGDKFDKVDEEQKDQWAHIGETREDVAKIKGALGINGAH